MGIGTRERCTRSASASRSLRDPLRAWPPLWTWKLYRGAGSEASRTRAGGEDAGVLRAACARTAQRLARESTRAHAATHGVHPRSAARGTQRCTAEARCVCAAALVLLPAATRVARAMRASISRTGSHSPPEDRAVLQSAQTSKLKKAAADCVVVRPRPSSLVVGRRNVQQPPIRRRTFLLN